MWGLGFLLGSPPRKAVDLPLRPVITVVGGLHDVATTPSMYFLAHI